MSLAPFSPAETSALIALRKHSRDLSSVAQSVAAAAGALTGLHGSTAALGGPLPTWRQLERWIDEVDELARKCAADAERLDLRCECCGEPAGEGGALCPACQESR